MAPSMKKLVIGVLLSILLVYLSVRGIDFSAVAAGFGSLNTVYLYPTLALLVLMQVIRSIRWGLLLAPLEKIGQFNLFAVTSVGFLAIVSIPARLGELARPYLITKKSGVTMGSALGTIFIERVCDSLTVLGIFLVSLMMTPLPSWLIRSSAIFLCLTLALAAFAFLLLLRREACMAFIDPLMARLPGSLGKRIVSLIHHVIDGFQIATDPGRLAAVAFLSVFFWVCDLATIYLMFRAFGFALPLVAAGVLLVILMIGIAIPAGPGFVGNWHFFCILGLSLYGIPKAEALSFAIVYHFLSIGVIVLLGLVFLPFNRFSLREMKRQAAGNTP